MNGEQDHGVKSCLLPTLILLIRKIWSPTSRNTK